jgi:hypothetical protein
MGTTREGRPPGRRPARPPFRDGRPSCTIRPPTTVSSTVASRTSAGDAWSGSTGSAMRSASFPTSSVPFRSSSNAAYALPRVYQRTASAIGIAHSRPWTPASWVSRVTEDQSPSSGW